MLVTFFALFAAFFSGFFVVGGAIHWFFHVRRREDAAAWKHQPDHFQSRRQILAKLPWVFGNSLILHGSLAVVLTFAIHGRTATYWSLRAAPIGWTVASTLLLPVWYHLMLYYVHRAMHRPSLMRLFHHVHHSDRSPMFLDALVEHPVEASWGAIVLTLPLCVLPLYGWGYVGFVALVGVHEILDHAGVNLDIPLLSRAKHHDEHHRRFNGYYGQLLPWLDRWEGTDTIEKTPRRTR